MKEGWKQPYSASASKWWTYQKNEIGSFWTLSGGIFLHSYQKGSNNKILNIQHCQGKRHFQHLQTLIYEQYSLKSEEDLGNIGVKNTKELGKSRIERVVFYSLVAKEEKKAVHFHGMQ